MFVPKTLKPNMESRGLEEAFAAPPDCEIRALPRCCVSICRKILYLGEGTAPMCMGLGVSGFRV